MSILRAIGILAAAVITAATAYTQTLAAQGSDPGDWPNHEPSGMVEIISVDGSSKNWPRFGQAGPWRDDKRVSLVDDPDSKYGQAIEKRFFAGDQSGWNGLTYAGNFGAFEELYIRMVFRLSPNWQWHRSGGKYFYYGAAGRKRGVGPTQFVLGWQGDGTPFWIATGGDGRYLPNGVGPTTRDVYHTIELHHVASTSGANGSLRMWIDGVEVQSFRRVGKATRTNVPLVNREWSATRGMDDKRLSGIQGLMFWGGQDDTKRVNDWVRFSELYISGKSEQPH